MGACQASNLHGSVRTLAGNRTLISDYAVLQCRTGHDSHDALRLPLASALIVREEEKPVFLERSADGPSKDVTYQLRGCIGCAALTAPFRVSVSLLKSGRLPVYVTPACRDNSSGTLPASSGSAFTWFSSKAIPNEASVVFSVTVWAETSTVCTAVPTSRLTLAVPGVFTSSCRLVCSYLRKLLISTVKTYVPGGKARTSYSPVVPVVDSRVSPNP